MERIFDIIPASSGPIIFLLVIAVIFILIIGLLGYIAYSSKNARFEIGDEGLRISRSLYGRFIPKEEISTEDVRILDLSIDSDYKPKRRTNGAGLPGYSEGWFKLKNDEKALVFVTDRSSVVYIPTSKDYSVLLSVREAEVFTELFKRWE